MRSLVVVLFFSILLMSGVDSNAEKSAGTPEAKTSVPRPSQKMEFDDQSINTLDPDFAKLDLTSVGDSESRHPRLYPIRKTFKKEQNDQIQNWGADQ